MDFLIGQIVLLPYARRDIRGLMRCEGQVLPIHNYAALFSLITSQYGGDGQTTFALPNLKSKSPLEGMAYYIVTEGLYPSFE